MREPSWWYGGTPQWQTAALRPLSHMYGALAARRIAKAKPYRCKFPVVCIGNFTAGGTGKTPTALRIAALLRQMEFEPVFLSRGYGGTNAGPMKVDLTKHTARDAGDEAMLLARAASTIISRDRVRGAQLIEATAPANTVIVMDDGLQNPALAKDFSLAVIDSRRGLGNGEVIPAGPLRAPMGVQAKLADAVIVNGEAASQRMQDLRESLPGFQGWVFTAHVAPAQNGGPLKAERFVAFAGIANPDRFFALARAQGATLLDTIVFSDHHAFSESDAARLIAAADQYGAGLITTEKDAVRFMGLGDRAAMVVRRLAVLKIELVLDDEDGLKALLQSKLAGRK